MGVLIRRSRVESDHAGATVAWRALIVGVLVAELAMVGAAFIGIALWVGLVGSGADVESFVRDRIALVSLAVGLPIFFVLGRAVAARSAAPYSAALATWLTYMGAEGVIEAAFGTGLTPAHYLAWTSKLLVLLGTAWLEASRRGDSAPPVE